MFPLCVFLVISSPVTWVRKGCIVITINVINELQPTFTFIHSIDLDNSWCCVSSQYRKLTFHWSNGRYVSIVQRQFEISLLPVWLPGYVVGNVLRFHHNIWMLKQRNTASMEMAWWSTGCGIMINIVDRCSCKDVVNYATGMNDSFFMIILAYLICNCRLYFINSVVRNAHTHWLKFINNTFFLRKGMN